MATDKAIKNIKKRLLFGGTFVLAMIFIMISVSFSWLNNNPRATVSDIHLEVVEANNLLVKAEDSDNWTKVVKMDFKEGFEMASVCGDGKNFFKPILGHVDGSNDFEAVGYEAISGNLEDNGLYEFAFSCMVESSFTIYLDKESSLSPSEDSENSLYGDYSSGHICAAMRIAFFQKIEDEYVLHCIWIPNSTTELLPSGEEIKVENGEIESGYIFISDESGESTTIIETEGASSGSKTVNGVTYVWGDLEENLEIGTTEGNQQQYFKLIIWVDGNDRECHNALMDGLVSVDLKILVDNKTEEGE